MRVGERGEGVGESGWEWVRVGESGGVGEWGSEGGRERGGGRL